MGTVLFFRGSPPKLRTVPIFSRHRFFAGFPRFLILFLCADQWLKWLVQTRMTPGETIPLLPFLYVTYVRNTGAAFGLLRGAGPLLILVSVAVILVLASSLRRDASSAATDGPSRCQRYGMMLILGGAAGNLMDRVRLGYVVDFVDLRVWPVFNLADSAITVGIGLLLWGMVWKQEAGKRK